MLRILWERLQGPRGRLVLIVLVWAAVAAPFVAGRSTLLFRDVFASHLPLKALGAAELAHGRLPAFLPQYALGQPFRGDPNALPFYPGNLLYLLLPFWSAFNAHYFLHWLLALFTMRKLARELGQGEDAALFAGLVYAGSGFLLTALSFYNLLAVAAWMPLVLAGLARGGRRGTLIAGLAGGWVLLGGEPISAALAAPLALLAVARSATRMGIKLRSLAAAALLAALVAAPQIVATARVLPGTYRGAHGLPVEQVATNVLSPWRLVELVLPLPWGVPTLAPPRAHWATGLLAWEPYISSLALGVVAAALALVAARRHAAWAAAAIAAFALGWAAGLSPELLIAATRGIFRYPQKLLFPFTLAASILAGWGFERALGDRRVAGWMLRLAALLALAGAAGFWRQETLAGWLGARFAPGAPAVVLAVQARSWAWGTAAASLLLVVAARGLATRRASFLFAAQLAGCLQLAPLVARDATATYREPAVWAALAGRGASVVSLPSVFPGWEPRPLYPRVAHAAAPRHRLDRELLDPATAVASGLSAPLAPDLDGFVAPLQVFLSKNLALADWPARLRWLRRLGVGALVRDGAGEVPGLEPLATASPYGVRSELLRLPPLRAAVFRPSRVSVAVTPPEAFARVASGALADDEAVVPAPVPHGASGAVTLVRASGDEVVVDVEGDGGVVALLRGYQRLWRAELEDGRALATLPVDLVLLGAEVPPGRHRVRFFVAAWPEAMAGLVALLALLGGLGALAARRRAE
jgi:hypothetical protein